MGSSHSTYKRTREGHRIDPSNEPDYFHLIEEGNGTSSSIRHENARSDIDSSLSSMRVCKAASRSLERILRQEYFTNWDENCDVSEFRNFTRYELDNLFDKIHEMFSVTGTDIRPKLRGIQWADTWSHKVYEFSFGNLSGSGTIYFGVIALGKEKSAAGDTFDAITCLYKLDFKIGEEKVTKRTYKHFLGIEVDSQTSTWYETKTIGFVTQKALANFCRVKALVAFQKRGLASSINDVLTFEDLF